MSKRGNIYEVITGCEKILCRVYSLDLVSLSAKTQNREELEAHQLPHPPIGV